MAELTWQGKYDKEGRRVAPVRVALPFQTIETVNESAKDRKRTLSLFSEGKQEDWRNRLMTSHQYEVPGTYVVVVKVIDILGNDTTKALTVKAR